MLDFDIALYEKKHIKTAFDCGIQPLNQYLLQYASQDVRKNFAALFVAVHDATEKILGYYTLSNASVLLENIPEALRRTLPKYREVPAIRLGRLAVDVSVQGQGIGVKLLGNAIERSVSNVAAWALMVVDAKDEKARDFYTRFGFTSLLDDKLHLYAMRHDLEMELCENGGR